MKRLLRPRLALTLALLVVALCALVHAGGSRASARTEEVYRVFCVNGKVSFGSRTLSEMQWDYGRNVCVLNTFKTYAEAKEDVRRRGGVGAACDPNTCQRDGHD